MSRLRDNVVGKVVECATCHKRKSPIGRSAPMEMYLCDDDCPGYSKAPLSGSLWPGESEAEFGYPVGEVGTTAEHEG